MKRGRDTLTGGTGDVNLQVLTLPPTSTIEQNAYRQVQVALPVNRLGQSKGKAVVIEVLKVWFDLPSFPGTYETVGQVTQAQAQLSTTSQPDIQHEEPTVFAYASQKFKGSSASATLAASVSATWVTPIVLDLTDGAGHGLLIAVDTIFFGIDTDSYPAPGVSFNAKIFYRFKQVDLTEYIGIVQSQSVTASRA